MSSSYRHSPTIYSQMDDDAANLNKEDDLRDLPSFARIVAFNRGDISTLDGCSYQYVVDYLSIDPSINALFIMPPLHLVYTLDWFSNVSTRRQMRERGVTAKRYTDALIACGSVASAERSVLGGTIAHPAIVAPSAGLATRSRIVRSRFGHIICITNRFGRAASSSLLPWDSMRADAAEFAKSNSESTNYAEAAYVDMYMRYISMYAPYAQAKEEKWLSDVRMVEDARASLRAMTSCVVPPAAPLVGVESNPGPPTFEEVAQRKIKELSRSQPEDKSKPRSVVMQELPSGETYAHGMCVFFALINQLTVYRQLQLRLVIGSLGFGVGKREDAHYEYGRLDWRTAHDFIKPDQRSTDLHAWLEDSNGNIYDIASDFWLAYAYVHGKKTDNLSSYFEVIRGASKPSLSKRGFHHVAAPLVTQRELYVFMHSVHKSALDSMQLDIPTTLNGVVPPAAPLVGIELNPGPHGRFVNMAALDAAARAVSIERDAAGITSPCTWEQGVAECVRLGAVLLGQFVISPQGVLSYRGFVPMHTLMMLTVSDGTRMIEAFKPNALELSYMRRGESICRTQGAKLPISEPPTIKYTVNNIHTYTLPLISAPSVVPPAAPLVGIELNPGPGSSATGSSASINYGPQTSSDHQEACRANGAELAGVFFIDPFGRLTWRGMVPVRVAMMTLGINPNQFKPTVADLAVLRLGKQLTYTIGVTKVQYEAIMSQMMKNALSEATSLGGVPMICIPTTFTEEYVMTFSLEPPAAPLVGVELNPGPGSSSTGQSSSSSSSASAPSPPRSGNHGPQTLDDHIEACRSRGVELAGIFIISPLGRMTWRGITSAKLICLSIDPNQFRPTADDWALMRARKQITHTVGVTKVQFDALRDAAIKNAIAEAVSRGGIPMIHLPTPFAEEYVMRF